jgi:uncharacterized protein (DUF2132 family)
MDGREIRRMLGIMTMSKDAPESKPGEPRVQANNPLHGVTLEAMLKALHAYYGWPGLAEHIPVRCFQFEPSVTSSLRFLRQTPWARAKVESLYLYMQREQSRRNRAASA